MEQFALDRARNPKQEYFAWIQGIVNAQCTVMWGHINLLFKPLADIATISFIHLTKNWERGISGSLEEGDQRKGWYYD